MNEEWKCPVCGAINTNWRFDTIHKIKTQEDRYAKGICSNCEKIANENEKKYQDNIKKEEQRKNIKSLLHRSQLPPKIINANFKNLEIPKGAEIAFKTMKKIARADRWVYIYGDNSTGKTLLAGATINMLAELFIPGYYFNERALFRRLKDTIRKDSKETNFAIFQNFHVADIIIWDDFATILPYSRWEYGIAYDIMELCETFGKILVLISNIDLERKLKESKMNPEENTMRRVTSRIARNNVFYIRMNNKPF